MASSTSVVVASGELVELVIDDSELGAHGVGDVGGGRGVGEREQLGDLGEGESEVLGPQQVLEACHVVGAVLAVPRPGP